MDVPKFHIRTFVILACIVCLNLHLNAQRSQIFFTSWTIPDGLSSNLCEEIIQDHDGYIWIATANGLNKFDGHRYQIFRNIPGDSTSLRNNELQSVHEDNSGRIWVGQNGTISVLNQDRTSFIHYDHQSTNPNSYSGGLATEFFEDREKNLWITTIGGGLNLYQQADKSFLHFVLFDNHKPDSKVGLMDISEDNNGNLWLASYNGLCELNSETKEFKLHEYKSEDENNKSFNNLSLTVFCDNQFIWYGTWGSGLHRYDRKTGEIHAFTYNSAGPMNLTNIVHDIRPRDENSLWIGTEQGLAIFDKNTQAFHFYKHEADNPHSLSGNDIRSTFTDKQNALWVVTNNGINMADPSLQNFSVIEFPDKTMGSQLIHDADKHKIYSVRYYDKRSLLMYDETLHSLRQFPIPHADEMKSEPFGFFQDSGGIIWIGGVKTGIYLFNPNTELFTKLETEKQLHLKDVDLKIRSITEDSEGNIWISSFAYGMIKYNRNTKQFKRFSFDSSGNDHIPFSACGKILRGPDKNMWGIFLNEGICAINENDQIIYSSENDLVKSKDLLKDISDAAIDDQNRLWVTTKSNGLLRIDWQQSDKNQLNSFNTNNAFPDNNLNSVVLDDNQNLWIAGSDGIIFFDPKSSKSKSYSEKDGVFPYSPSFNLVNANNGEIWFTTKTGYCAFTPNNFLVDSTSLRVIINSFKVFDKELFPNQNRDIIESIHLENDQNFLSIEFSALCFSGPDAVEYAYLLEGFDSEWHYCGHRRYASYTDLKPGDYLLKIKAANRDGIWSAIPKTLQITISPAWWQTIWFKILIFMMVILLTIATAMTISRVKVKRLEQLFTRQQEVQEIRNRIARDIHDELGSGLTKISLMSSKLNSSKVSTSDIQSLPEKIQKASHEVIESLSEIVWTINPKNDSLGNLISYIRQYIGKYFDATSIQYTFDANWNSEDQKRFEISPEIKRNLLMILKESLNNIVKHSGASHCVVQINFDEKHIHLSIADDGNGFKTRANESMGNGLKNMQRRSEECGGTFQINSTSGKGITVQVSFPIS